MRKKLDVGFVGLIRYCLLRRRVIRILSKVNVRISEIGERCGLCYWDMKRKYSDEVIRAFKLEPSIACRSGDSDCIYLWSGRAECVLKELVRYTLFSDILNDETVEKMKDALSDLEYLKKRKITTDEWITKWDGVLSNYKERMRSKYGFYPVDPDSIGCCACGFSCDECVSNIIKEDKTYCSSRLYLLNARSREINDYWENV